MGESYYERLLASIRPLKKMHAQWIGFIAVCGLVGSVLTYNFVRMDRGVERIDTELRTEIDVLENDVIRFGRDVEHISPARMVNIDTAIRECNAELEELREEVKRLRKRVRR